MLRSWWMVGAALALAGCGGEEFESVDATASSSGSSGQGGTGAAGDECPSGSVCVAAPPEGWDGPVALYVGDDPPDACPAGWTETLTGHIGEPDAQHSCSACECGSPLGVTCSFPTVTVYFDGNCTDEPQVTTLTSEACTDIGGGYGVKATPSSPGGGSCALTGGVADKRDPVWAESATVCGVPAASTNCSSGVCAPVAEAPFRGPSCVHRSGDFMCPDLFPDRTLLFRGVVDGRSCTDCGCSAPTGASCEGALVIHGVDGCAGLGEPLVLPMDNQCHGYDFCEAAKFDAGADGGSCTPSGGEPKGAVENAEPVTVCCAR